MALVFNPLSPDFVRDPYTVYARLREEAPVYVHESGFSAVSRHADVGLVLKSPELFSSSAMGGDRVRTDKRGNMMPATGALIGQDPPVHTGQRRIVNRGFTPRRVADLEPMVRAASDELLDGFGDATEVDLMERYANPLPTTVIAQLLGMDPTRRGDFKRWANMMVIGSTSGMGFRTPEYREEIDAFRDYLLETIEERRENPGDDLISVLIDAQAEEGILSPEQVFGFVSLLLIAGSETTTNLIGNAILAMDANPEVRERVTADPSLVPQWIDETLRYDPPVQMVYRLCKQDTEVSGVKLREGAPVMALIGSANRDPARFEHPERFDLDRDTTPHLAFGFGNHYCLGASLARLEARIALSSLIERWPDLAVKPGGVEHHGSFLVRGPRRLELTL